MRQNTSTKLKYTPAKYSLLGSLSFLILFSCKSPEQHADSAFDILKQKKEMQSDSVYVETILSPETLKTKPEQKIEIRDEWTKFKSNADTKIKANDLEIEQISKTKNLSDKILKHLNSLKTDNNDLRRTIDNYKEEEKVRWESFKTSTNHDVNSIAIELKDININSKNN